MANYPASKVAAEKEVWRFVEEQDLHFNVNVVSPAAMIREPLSTKHVEGQASWVDRAFRGNKMGMGQMQAGKTELPSYPIPGYNQSLTIAAFFMDVKDVALIHVAAVLDPEVKNARLQSWGHSAHWNEVLSILRRLCPQRKFADDYPDPYHLMISVDQTESVMLLRAWSDRPNKNGWQSLEVSIFENISNPYLEA